MDETDVTKHTTRGTWGRKVEFILTLTGLAVGMGNIWRFPYLCMRNGGGAFLIPYAVSLIFCGIPIFYLELYIGQFSSRSPTKIWNICPLLTGIGWGSVVFCTATAYHVILMTWLLYYFYHSFSASLPWSSCHHEWNTQQCVDGPQRNAVSNLTLDLAQMSITNATRNVSTSALHIPTSPAEEFFERKMLDLSAGIEHIGTIKWDVFGFYCLCWVLMFACICKGVKSLGKVVYVTATAPYVLLIVLLIRGVTLPGAVTGLKYFITPNFSKLLQPKVWVEANLQVFFSIGNAIGGPVTMASYNKFNNQFHKEAVAVPLVNAATSLLGGFVTFSVIGFMAQQTGSSVEQVIRSGPSLAFIAYPEALSRMPGAPVWAVLFFLTLLSVAFDTFLGSIEVVACGLEDTFPKLRKYKICFTALVVLMMFMLGLPCTTRGGMYVFQVVDWYAGAICLFLISLAECLVVVWLYGHKRFYYDIEFMTGKKPSVLWKICLCSITPTMLFISMIYILTSMYPPKYGSYEYPWWAIAIGWAFAFACILPLPIGVIWAIMRESGSIFQRIREAAKPNAKWGPANIEHRLQYKYAAEYRSDALLLNGCKL